MAEQTDAQKAERDKALKKAYQSATARLRDENRDAFNTIYAEEAKKQGVEWSPKKSKEEKAKEEMDRLLAEFPFLREQVGSDAAGAAPAKDPVPEQSDRVDV